LGRKFPSEFLVGREYSPTIDQFQRKDPKFNKDLGFKLAGENKNKNKNKKGKRKRTGVVFEVSSSIGSFSGGP